VARQQQHRDGHDDRHLLRRGQREALGHQFAHHDLDEGDQREAEHHAEHSRIGLQPRGAAAVQQGGDVRAQRIAGDGAGDQHQEGDADLDGGEEVFRLLGVPQRQRGAAAAARHLLQAALARGDQGHLGQCEEAVAQGEHEDERDFGQHRGDRGEGRMGRSVAAAWCDAPRWRFGRHKCLIVLVDARVFGRRVARTRLSLCCDAG